MRSEKLHAFLSTASFVTFMVLAASLAIQKPSIYILFGNEISLTDAIFPLVAVLTFISLVTRSIEFKWRNFYLFAIAYVAAFVLASAVSDEVATSAVKTASTLYLVLIAICGAILIDSGRRIRTAMVVFLYASLIPILVGLFTIVLFYLDPESSLLPYLTYHYGAVPVGNYPRISATFVSASMFCNYLNVVLMVALIAWKKKWVAKAVLVPAIIAIWVCAIFTISAGLGGIFLAVGVWIWNEQRTKTIGRVVLFAGTAACIGSLFASFIALQHHPTAPYSFNFFGFELYPSSRLLVWSEAWKTFADNFLFGNGPGNRSAAVVFQNSEGSYSLLTDAHNSFLSVATQTGILGFTAFVTLTIYILTISFRDDRKDPITFGLAVAFLTAFVIQGLTGSFEDARHLWFLIGIVGAASYLTTGDSATELGSST
jgi:O-antigen ligase